MLVRFLAVIGGTAIVIAVGVLSGMALQKHLSEKLIVDAVKVGAFAAVAWGFLKHSAENVQALSQYVRDGKTDQLLRPTIQGLTILFVGGLTFGIREPSSPPSLIAISQLMVGESSEVVVLEEKFSVPFDVGRVEGTGCDVETKTWGKGTEVGREQEAVLGRLADAFRACSEGDGSEQVIIDVLGFASAREFTCPDGDPDHSDAMNLALSEARREAVIEVLRRSEKQSGATFEIIDELQKHWGGRWDQMRANLGFSDSDSSGQVVSAREPLTRRVDIVVKNKGACRPR